MQWLCSAMPAHLKVHVRDVVVLCQVTCIDLMLLSHWPPVKRPWFTSCLPSPVLWSPPLPVSLSTLGVVGVFWGGGSSASQFHCASDAELCQWSFASQGGLRPANPTPFRNLLFFVLPRQCVVLFLLSTNHCCSTPHWICMSSFHK